MEHLRHAVECVSDHGGLESVSAMPLHLQRHMLVCEFWSNDSSRTIRYIAPSILVAINE